MTAVSALLLSGALGADSAVGRKYVEYVSIDCPRGDIALRLNADGTFLLRLLLWNDLERRHDRADELSCTWTCEHRILALEGASRLTYRTDAFTHSRGETVPSSSGVEVIVELTSDFSR